ARVPRSLLRRGRRGGERPAVPVPAASRASAALHRRCTAPRLPSRVRPSRRMDAGRTPAGRASAARRRPPGRRRGGRRDAAPDRRPDVASAGGPERVPRPPRPLRGRGRDARRARRPLRRPGRVSRHARPAGRGRVRVVEHATVSAFLARAEAWLLAAEVERALILGLCADLKTQGVAGGPPCLVTLEDGDAVVSASMRTPPYNLVVSRAPTSAFGVLATWLGERDGTIPGVEGPTVDAGVFAEGWVAATG